MGTVLWTVLGVLVVGLTAMALLQIAMGVRARQATGRRVDELPALAEAATGTRLVYFWSPSCGPCRAMKPTMDALRAAGGQVTEVDVSRDPETALRLGVMGTPTTLLVRDGAVAEVLLGVQPRERLERLLSGAA